MWRNYKWIWLPLVFILLGILQPISTYFMPEILESLGGLPEGAVIEIPLPSAGAMLANTLSQFNSMGVLVIVLAFMGIVASEFTSGVVHMIMVKPVKFYHYILGKWLAAVTLVICALLLGYTAAWYYTDLLFEPIDFMLVVNSFVVYSIWLTVIISIVLFFSTILKSQGSIAFLSLLITIVLSVLPAIVPKLLKYSPGTLADYAYSIVQQGMVEGGWIITIFIAFATIVTLLFAAVFLYKSASHNSA